MLRLTRADQWFPERVAGLVAQIQRAEVDLCVTVDAEPVRGNFPYSDGRVRTTEIRDWLLHIAKSAGALPGPNLEGWAALTASRIAEFAHAKLARPDAFHA